MKKKILNCFVAVFALVSVNIFTGFSIEPSNNKETKYCGAGVFTEKSETINYSRKETTSYSINGDLPNYYSLSSNSGCANIAGAVLIGYYDRFCENLVPDFKTCVQLGSIIRYRTGSDEIKQVMESLYTLMGTDAGSAGTTYGGFQSGMTSYVNNCNYSYTIEDVGSLNFSKYKTAVENNKPVALFLLNFSFAVTGQDNGSSEVIKSHYNSVAHVAVGCGYKIDTYYNSNDEVIATRTYLKVASGFQEYGIAYLCLDGKSNVYKATSVVIQ